MRYVANAVIKYACVIFLQVTLLRMGEMAGFFIITVPPVPSDAPLPVFNTQPGAGILGIPSFLRIVELSNQAVILIMRHLHEKVVCTSSCLVILKLQLPIIASDANEHTECRNSMNNFLSTLESIIMAGINASIDGIV